MPPETEPGVGYTSEATCRGQLRTSEHGRQPAGGFGTLGQYRVLMGLRLMFNLFGLCCLSGRQ